MEPMGQMDCETLQVSEYLLWAYPEVVILHVRDCETGDFLRSSCGSIERSH